jgi:uncharacterized protein
VDGTLAADLKVGQEMELTTMPLFVDDEGVERIVYAWRIVFAGDDRQGSAIRKGQEERR